MTIQDLKEYKRNATKILRDNTQYATASATEKAFDALIALYEGGNDESDISEEVCESCKLNKFLKSQYDIHMDKKDCIFKCEYNRG